VNNHEVAGKLLRTARLAAGQTQLELARRSGEAQSVISAYERGRRQPSAAALARLLDAAGYRIVLVRSSRPQVDVLQAARHLAELLDLADHLPTRRREDVLRFPALPGLA
jgi:transcriptional regulator with XRE-family HTH domain